MRPDKAELRRQWATDLAWQLPNPFISQWSIRPEHIDHYGHTNNVAYLSRLESLAWEHSSSLGLCFEDYKALDRAMVITQHELNYHLASHLGDELACATWLVHCDNKLRLGRRFQFINLKNKKTIFTARTEFVCVSLQTGTPKKMPQDFIEIYGKAVRLSTV